MSKLVSISISLLILIQSFGFGLKEMYQISSFVEHASFHNQEYGDDVFVFISKHYGELKASHEKEHQEEKKEHERLPFKHHSHVSCSYLFVLNSLQEDVFSVTFFDFKKHSFFYQSQTYSQYLEGLFQPPKFS